MVFGTKVVWCGFYSYDVTHLDSNMIFHKLHSDSTSTMTIATACFSVIDSHATVQNYSSSFHIWKYSYMQKCVDWEQFYRAMSNDFICSLLVGFIMTHF